MVPRELLVAGVLLGGAATVDAVIAGAGFVSTVFAGALALSLGAVFGAGFGLVRVAFGHGPRWLPFVLWLGLGGLGAWWLIDALGAMARLGTKDT